MSQQSSTIPGITNPTITSTGPGSPAQQAYANQQSSIARQNMANQMATGGRKYKSKGGAIALAPMQPGTSPSQVALNAQVQQSGSQSAANSMYDNQVNKTTGGKKKTRKNKMKTRKTRRNHKKSKRRRTKGNIK
jgi:hypothetical protein